MSKPPDHIKEFYRILWPVEAESGDRLSLLDSDLGGRPLEQSLFNEMQQIGLHAGSKLLDIGCGQGDHTRKFSQVFGCKVIGVDPLESNLSLARAHAQNDRIQYLIGSMDSLEIADRSCDWIWSYNAFNYVKNMPAAMRECARVLKPGGQMLMSSALAPDWSNVAEIRGICAQLGMNADTLKQTVVENAFHSAGLIIRLAESTSDVDSVFFESFTGEESRDFLRLARLVRARSLFRKKLGSTAYAYLQAYYLWNIHLMTGRAEYYVWRLEKEAY